MNKSSSRVCAFKIIYEYLFHSDFDYDLSLNSVLDCENELAELNEEELQYVKSVFDCVVGNRVSIDEKIITNLKDNKKLTDIYALDYSLVVLAIASIDYMGEDKSLIINEVVRIAKKYSTDKSYAFINGFLSSIYGEQ